MTGSGSKRVLRSIEKSPTEFRGPTPPEIDGAVVRAGSMGSYTGSQAVCAGLGGRRFAQELGLGMDAGPDWSLGEIEVGS